jgi:hypothetical protein
MYVRNAHVDLVGYSNVGIAVFLDLVHQRAESKNPEIQSVIHHKNPSESTVIIL